MLGIGKTTGILFLSIIVILSAATFLTTQNLDKSTSSDVAFLMGHMTLKLIDENGYVKNYVQTDNVIVESGWNALVENVFSGTYEGGLGLLNGTGAGPFSHIAVGASANTALASQTTLVDELAGCPRSPLFISSPIAVTSSGTSITVSLSAGFDAETDSGCTGTALNEAGLFNGTTAQNTVMFARNVFSSEVPALGSFDFLEIDWDFTFTSGL